jgi:hypothetical protein
MSLSHSLINQDFLSTCETFVAIPKTMMFIQSMLGIKVNKTRETLPNVLVEYLGSARAGFQFSMLARYHPIDVVALMEKVCPHQNSGYLFLLF